MAQSKLKIDNNKEPTNYENITALLFFIVVLFLICLDNTEKDVVMIEPVWESTENKHPQTSISPDEEVSYNQNTGKYHLKSCRWAKKCTHCVVTTKKEAEKDGGKPCRVCVH